MPSASRRRPQGDAHAETGRWRRRCSRGGSPGRAARGMGAAEMDDHEFHSGVGSLTDRGSQPRELIAIAAEVHAGLRRRWPPTPRQAPGRRTPRERQGGVAQGSPVVAASPGHVGPPRLARRSPSRCPGGAHPGESLGSGQGCRRCAPPRRAPPGVEASRTPWVVERRCRSPRSTPSRCRSAASEVGARLVVREPKLCEAFSDRLPMVRHRIHLVCQAPASGRRQSLRP